MCEVVLTIDPIPNSDRVVLNLGVFPPQLNRPYVFNCPHCGCGIQVEQNQINCKIFRCGVMLDGSLVNPHLPKAMCDKLFGEGKIRGCGKPFRFDGTTVSICDYI